MGKLTGSVTSGSIMSVSGVSAIDETAWKCLATTLRDMTASRSADDIIDIAGRAARQICEADSVSLRLQDSSPLAATHGESSVLEHVTTLIDVRSGVTSQDVLLTVKWKSAHEITASDRTFLETLSRAAALALRATARNSPGAVRANRFEPAERARFFDLQRQVRGLLATVRSIVRRMAESTTSVEEYAAHLEGRLGALARVRGFLMRAPDARVDLEELVRAEFLAQCVRDEQVQIHGPRVLLAPREAETLGLALHELATNSIKFGALGRADDQLRLTWRVEESPRGEIVLDWREHVERMLPGNERKGFGFEVIELMLPYELGGSSSMAVTPEGLHCLLTFPMTPHETPCTS